MHVALILEATAGGARKHVRYLAGGLRRAGVQVDLVLSPLHADPDFDADLQFYREQACSVYLVDLTKGPSPGDLAAIKRVRQILERREPDVVHTHCAKAGLVGRLAARALPRVRVVHTPHSYFFQGLHNPLSRHLGVRLERWLGRQTDLLLAIGESERDLALQWRLLPAERIVVAPNGLPADFAATLGERAAIRRELGLSDEQFALGVCSRLVPKKGHAWLFDAVAAVPPDQRRHLRVFCFGDGPLRERLRQRIAALGLQELVTLPGYVPAAERLLPGLDLGVLPSFYEGLSYQLLETLAAGLPLIATDVPGNRLSQPGNPVLYVQPEGAAQLASLIAGLHRHPDERLELGRRGRAWVAAHFALDRQVATIVAAYERLLRTAR